MAKSDEIVMLVAFCDRKSQCTCSQACAAVRGFTDLVPAVVPAWGEAGDYLWLPVADGKEGEVSSALTELGVRVIGVMGVAPVNI